MMERREGSIPPEGRAPSQPPNACPPPTVQPPTVVTTNLPTVTV